MRFLDDTRFTEIEMYVGASSEDISSDFFRAESLPYLEGCEAYAVDDVDSYIEMAESWKATGDEVEVADRCVFVSRSTECSVTL